MPSAPLDRVPARAATAGPTRAEVVSRVLASLLGSYAFVWGFAALGTVLGVAAGMPFDDAQTLLFLIAFLAFVACCCWGLHDRSLLRVWFVLLGSGAVMTAAAWFGARALV